MNPINGEIKETLLITTDLRTNSLNLMGTSGFLRKPLIDKRALRTLFVVDLLIFLSLRLRSLLQRIPK